MVIKVLKSKCEHLEEHSIYNRNCYKLPFKIEDCSCVMEIYDELWDSYLYHLGDIIDGTFISSGIEFEVDYSDACINSIILDSELENL